MAFHFPLMPRLFMAIRQEDRHPISEILLSDARYSRRLLSGRIFLRNHDELTLEMVTDEERDYMYQTYAADPQMRVNVGIRRRLAPLMENSRRRIELMNGLLLSLPGTPVIYYGDEIGMGDNVYLGDRNGVRTPMQWTADRNGGFSRCDPAAALRADHHGRGLRLSVGQRRGAGPIAVFAAQLDSPAYDRAAPAASRVRPRLDRAPAPGESPDLRVHPPARRRRSDSRRRESRRGRCNRRRSIWRRDAGLVPIEMSGGTELPRITSSPYFLTLGPYAFYWLVLKRQPVAPVTVRPIAAAGDADTEALPLLLGPDWSRTLAGASRRLLERDYLAPFLRRQRWFAANGAIERVRIADWGTLRDGDEPVFVTILAATVRGRP